MFVFVCWTFAIPFVMMNLLIAFVADTYVRVYEHKEIANYCEMANLIVDLELLYGWCIKDKKEKKFLSYVSNSEKDIHNDIKEAMGHKISVFKEEMTENMELVKSE
jgi:hypothetical protein